MKKKKLKLSLNKNVISKLNAVVGGVEPTHTACSNCTVCDATQGGTYCLEETEYPRCATNEPQGCVTGTCNC